MSEETPFQIEYDSDTSSSEIDPVPKQIGRFKRSEFRRKDKSLLLSIIVNVLLGVICAAILAFYRAPAVARPHQTPDTEHDPMIPPGIDDEFYMPVNFGWEYAAATVDQMDDVDRNWAAINPDVGAVTFSREDLARLGYAPGQDNPHDPSVGIHLVQAYHALHCLKVIRHTMFQLVRGEPLDMRFGHSTHCLASLLRDTVCRADYSLPIAAPGADYVDTEYPHLRKCRNWAALEAWAANKTTCMKTSVEGVLDKDHVDGENCTRKDGVLVPFSLELKRNG